MVFGIVFWLRALAGLIWPQRCPGCGRADVLVCPACLAQVVRPAFPAPVELGAPCWAASAYGGVPARLIVAWKERGGRALTGPLSLALTGCLRTAHAAQPRASPVLVVPVPASRRGRRERGTDLIADLTRAALRPPGGPTPGRPSPGLSPPGRGDPGGSGLIGSGLIVVPALTHRRRVRDQAGLRAAERRTNLRGALAVRPRFRRVVRNQPVIVVDDIVTTGATVTEAVRALTADGAHVVGICCLSVTLRHQRMPRTGTLH